MKKVDSAYASPALIVNIALDLAALPEYLVTATLGMLAANGFL